MCILKMCNKDSFFVGWSEAEPLHPTGVASRILKSPTLKNHTYNDDDLNNDPGILPIFSFHF